MWVASRCDAISNDLKAWIMLPLLRVTRGSGRGFSRISHFGNRRCGDTRRTCLRRSGRDNVLRLLLRIARAIL